MSQKISNISHQKLSAEQQSSNSSLEQVTNKQATLEKIFASLSSATSIGAALAAIGSQQTTMDRLIKSTSSATSIGAALAAIGTQQTTMDRLIKSTSSATSIGAALAAIGTQQTTMDRLIKSTSSATSIGAALAAIGSQQTTMDRLIKSTSSAKSIGAALASISAEQTTMDRMIASLSSAKSIGAALATISAEQTTLNWMVASASSASRIATELLSYSKKTSPSDDFLNENGIGNFEANFIYEMSKTISSIDISEIKSSDFNVSSENLENDIRKIEQKSEFLAFYSKLPTYVQVIFFFLLLEIIFPQLNSISANFITTEIQEYLLDNNASNREKINTIKGIPSTLDQVNTESLRFITGNFVNLRSSPSIHSEIIEEMALGQVVTVLSKNRNWTKVMFECEDGELKTGWVFTRYTSKFKKR